jgi:hypothetical protein
MGRLSPREQAFNEYKSEVKFTEFTALGVPSVVKNMLPYSLVVNEKTVIHTRIKKSLR